MAILDGKPVAEKVQQEVKKEINLLLALYGRAPGLTVIIAGDDPASRVYVASKSREARKLGIRSEVIEYPAAVSRETLVEKIDQLNDFPEVDAILVQLPLPGHLDPWELLDRIDPGKDVDCLHPLNQGLVLLNRSSVFPCTPGGILRILDFYRIDPAGMNVAVVGRSFLVGKPAAMMLSNRNATVTLCHTRTNGLPDILRRADMVVAAAGEPGLVTADMVKPGAVLIDVGMNRLDTFADFSRYADPEKEEKFRKNGYVLVGDIHYRACEKASSFTPVPGGVGLMTVAMLMHNTVALHKKRKQGESIE